MIKKLQGVKRKCELDDDDDDDEFLWKCKRCNNNKEVLEEEKFNVVLSECSYLGGLYPPFSIFVTDGLGCVLC